MTIARTLRNWSKIRCGMTLGTLLFSVLLPTNMPSASESSACGDFVLQASEHTVEEVVRSAAYIGLFTVTSIESTELRISDESVPMFEYKLSLLHAVDGSPPIIERLIGLPPHDKIPSSYFATLRRHEKIRRGSESGGGAAVAGRILGNPRCQYLPRMIEGYSYLILGGVSSSLAFEFISDSREDGWYQLVREIADQDM